MNRRDLIKGAAALPLLGQTMTGKSAERPKLIKPKRLLPGDAVGLIAPASGVTAETWERAIKNIEDLGFKPVVGKFARGINGFLSGTDKERLSDLHWAFSDPAIKAVWCVRGGGGAPRLLPDIDYSLIRKNPKILIGFSDITALHLAIHQNCGLVTFHGPVASSQYPDYTKGHLLNVISRPSSPYKIGVSEFNMAKESPFYRTEVINKGKCRGRLIGGNLALLSALAGTKYALADLKGKILFIEEVNEPPYRIDRMLTQLRQSVDLRAVAGIALGVFEDTSASAGKTAQPVLDVIKDRLGDLGKPLIYGLSLGHIRDNITIPYGIEAELDVDDATLTYLESAVI
ncbi:MAG: LD-carboxypeptidase [Acidobacteria bacterium]|nr:LD-carboxypeptidase [Acidobacteriota bacterium]